MTISQVGVRANRYRKVLDRINCLRYTVLMIVKKCQYKECGKEFTAHHNSNRFCCQEHGYLNRRKPRLEGDCEYCHKHFVTKYTVDKWPYKSGHQKLRYCCKEHQLLAQRKDKIEVTCLVDGTKFKVYPSDIKYGRGKFCKRECYHKYYSGERSYLWKDGATDKNEKLRKSAAYKAWRIAIFIRDNKKCVICGRQYHKGTTEIEADHIYMRALFPELTLDIRNGRTLCRECHGDTPTSNLNKWKPPLTRADYMKGGRLYDYAKTSLKMNGINSLLIKE